MVPAPQNLVGNERCRQCCLKDKKQDAKHALPGIFSERIHDAEPEAMYPQCRGSQSAKCEQAFGAFGGLADTVRLN